MLAFPPHPDPRPINASAQVRDGQFPPEAHALFKSHGPSQGLFRLRGEEKGKVLRGEGLQDWGGALKRPSSKRGEPPVVLPPSKWERRCSEEECRLCAVRRIRRHSSSWSGTGIFSFLNDASTCALEASDDH